MPEIVIARLTHHGMAFVARLKRRHRWHGLIAGVAGVSGEAGQSSALGVKVAGSSASSRVGATNRALRQAISA